MTASSGYEFDASQNELFKDISKKMSLVGTLSLIGGILSLVMGIFVTIVWLFIQKDNVHIRNGINGIIQGGFLLLIGNWTSKAAQGFLRIVKTTDNDIENLMGALGELRKLYTLQYNLAIIGIVFIAFIFVLSIILDIAAIVTR